MADLFVRTGNMANVRSEYKEAYCTSAPKRQKQQQDFVMCTRNQSVQPVGGNITQLKRTAPDSVPSSRLPACDEDNVATVYTSADYGTHRIEPKWQVSE
jgi:hypothetical protein